MLKIDSAILSTNEVICKNIDKFDSSERGLLSQNILSQLRNFIEYIAQKIYSNGADINPNDYKEKEKAIVFIKSKGDLRFLYKFHNLLQKSVSHYTIDEDGSERLMLKYYEYLLKIKIFLKKKYNIEVLENIDMFPLNMDSSLMEYYEKIAIKIDNISSTSPKIDYNDRYYIQKIRNDLQFIVQHMKDVDIEELNANEILLDSMLFRMIQLSENAKKLSDEYKEKRGYIPWNAMYGLRNRIVHDYGNVDLNIVFETLKNDIPELLEMIKG